VATVAQGQFRALFDQLLMQLQFKMIYTRKVVR